jgi:hypothetical protein
VGLAPLSTLLAFLVGGVTTYFDCYSTLTARIMRVPSTFATNRWIIFLAVICGDIAALACWLTAGAKDSAIATILTLKADDPWRGAVVGASVLILIRSKLLNIKDSPAGGDYIYTLGRDIAIQDVNSRWSVVRTSFQNRNITAALADPQFQAQIVDLINTNIQARPDDFKKRVNDAVATVTGKRPPGVFNAADAVWGVYYRALMGVALDACGPEVVASLAGFTLP